ncbi:MAG: hypothetical protein PHN84_12840 [Desulfuromonadaceae bacterium]|nr:hypothetical protein [Desulfuromonadaceae bacterium]MDD2856471.1 hypothetical protein [Desulfuromonadaceae bacterium]
MSENSFQKALDAAIPKNEQEAFVRQFRAFVVTPEFYEMEHGHPPKEYTGGIFAVDLSKRLPELSET